MLEKIDAYLDVATRRPWKYGGGPGGFRGHDCCLFPANWEFILSGKDIASDLRETYSTRDEAEKIVSKHFGMKSLFMTRLERNGWRQVDAPKTGDIGMLTLALPDRNHVIGAIHRESRWLHADPRRILSIPFDAWPIWRWSAA